LRCGHELPPRCSQRYKAKCSVCGSFWDLDALGSEGRYDASYPKLRSHYDPAIGANKVRTLKSWLSELGIDLSPLTVCEVGFGGAHCLKFLYDDSREVFGIETIAENIEHAGRIGISGANLFLAHALPPALSAKIDLWLFQDSFEHLTCPDTFMEWLSTNSSERSRLLLVAPAAESISERLLGRIWPHKLADHTFHWTKRGLVDFMARRNFHLVTKFRPVKYISVMTIIAHLMHKSGRKGGLPEKWRSLSFLNLRFRVNIGEMGLLFRSGA
jgi:hypothetical protein